MSSYLEVSIHDIKALHPNHFRDLLARLLHAEAMLHKISNYDLIVSTKEFTSDGGIDGHFTTKNNSQSNYIKQVNNAYQIKAEKMTKQKCINEVQVQGKSTKILEANNPQKKPLKPKVREILEKGWTYILVISYAYPKSIDVFQNAIKETFKDYGFKNPIVEIIDGEKIKNWVNTFPSVIRYVKYCLKQGLNDSFRTIDQLQITKLHGNNNYVLTQFLKTQSNEVGNFLNSNSSNALRITGNSGIGKSRFIIETIASDNKLKANTLYIDLANSDCSDIVTNFISKCNQQNFILIVDNCSTDNHKRINEQNNNSNLIKLITIDNKKDDSIKDTRVINLAEEEQSEVVKNMLQPVLETHDASHALEHLVNICGGYPLLAQSVIDVIKDKGLNGINLGTLLDSGDLKKLLFNHFSENGHEITVLYMLSFFVYIRFKHNKLLPELIDNSLEHQIDLQNKFLCEIFLEPKGINQDIFNTTCNKLINKSIIEYASAEVRCTT